MMTANFGVKIPDSSAISIFCLTPSAFGFVFVIFRFWVGSLVVGFQTFINSLKVAQSRLLAPPLKPYFCQLADKNFN